ncbi:MAG TPA: O-antigen ligase family protein [Candidatus Tripitaka californicus]|uniref:O-antigen ligase family protein n=1 Tax=Candidatus Tripitaka californicus TaxID=3367616 RepID=UPI00402578C8|nr:O-antigen ligase family protein [Planctomycetota bacterium]
MGLKPSRVVIITLAFLFLIFNVVALLTALIPPKVVFVLVGGLIAFCITMLRLEYGLIILVFTLPWTLQLKVADIADTPFKIGSDDAVLFGAVLGWLAHMATGKVGPFPPSPLNLPIVAFVTWAGLSFIPLGLTKGASVLAICGLHLFKWVEFVLVYFIVLRVVNTEEQAKRFVVFSLISCAVIVAVQLALTATGRYGSEVHYGETTTKLFVPGVESNAILGAYYLLPLGIILSLLVSMGIRHKGLLIAFTIVLFIGLFFTYGRANYLGMATILLVLTISGGGARVRLPFIFLIIALCALVYFLPTVVERMSMTVHIEPGGILKFETSAADRLDMWRKATKVFVERPTNPLIGIGFWGVRFHGDWHATTVHNQYLAYLIEVGIVGFAIFCWLMKRVIHQILLLYRLSSGDYFCRALSIGFLAGVIGILVAAFFGEILESPRIMGPFWFMIAIIITLKNIKEEELEGEEAVSVAYQEAREGVVPPGRRFVDRYFR